MCSKESDIISLTFSPSYTDMESVFLTHLLTISILLFSFHQAALHSVPPSFCSRPILVSKSCCFSSTRWHRRKLSHTFDPQCAISALVKFQLPTPMPSFPVPLPLTHHLLACPKCCLTSSLPSSSGSTSPLVKSLHQHLFAPFRKVFKC